MDNPLVAATKNVLRQLGQNVQSGTTNVLDNADYALQQAQQGNPVPSINTFAGMGTFANAAPQRTQVAKKLLELGHTPEQVWEETKAALSPYTNRWVTEVSQGRDPNPMERLISSFRKQNNLTDYPFKEHQVEIKPYSLWNQNAD